MYFKRVNFMSYECHLNFKKALADEGLRYFESCSFGTTKSDSSHCIPASGHIYPFWSLLVCKSEQGSLCYGTSLSTFRHGMCQTHRDACSSHSEGLKNLHLSSHHLGFLILQTYYGLQLWVRRLCTCSGLCFLPCPTAKQDSV